MPRPRAGVSDPGSALASQRSLRLSSVFVRNSLEFRVPVFLYLFTMLTVQNCCFCNKTLLSKNGFVQTCPFTINVLRPPGRWAGRPLGPGARGMGSPGTGSGSGEALGRPVALTTNLRMSGWGGSRVQCHPPHLTDGAVEAWSYDLTHAARLFPAEAFWPFPRMGPSLWIVTGFPGSLGNKCRPGSERGTLAWLR